jgi:hypothetical protein
MFTTFDGDTFFTLQYNGDVLDAATALDSWLLQPPINFPYFCYFNQGQSTSLIDGVTLTQATSGAVIKVGRVITTGGALGSSTGAGVLFFQKVSGEIDATHALQVGASTYCYPVSLALNSPLGLPARAIFISVETNSIRFCTGGEVPTNAAGTPANFGTLLRDTQDIVLTSYLDMRNLQMISAVSTSNATVNVAIKY